jgi:hypothetical protein
MQHPIVPFAHAAFCTGFAASGADITERVRAGHKAAIELAIENCDDPNIIEATLQLGKLEGVWANIYGRRKELYDSGLADFSDVWSQLWSNAELSALVKAIREQAGVLERDNSPAVEKAAALVLAYLRNLMPNPLWQQLRLAVGDDISSGIASGAADAMELLADRIDVLGFNFNKAFAAVKKKFDADPDALKQADVWLNKLLQAVAADAARKLIAKLRAGDEDAEEFLEEELGKGNSNSFIVMLDNLIHGAISLGILWFYRNNGVTEVWWITAGDEAVCTICDAIEGSNPYSIASAPVPPEHVNCRCSLMTFDSISGSAISDFLD